MIQSFTLSPDGRLVLSMPTCLFLFILQLHTVGSAADQGAVTFDTTSPGRVSINIYDSTGAIIKELLHAAPCDTGSHTVYWDGTDRAGKSAGAGDYRWRMLCTGGLKTEYLTNLGTNFPGGGEWRAQAPGSHGAPHCVAVDETGIYIAARGTENIEDFMVKLSRDGKTRLWSAPHPETWKGGQALAVVDSTLYLLANSGTIWRYEAASGRKMGRIDAVYPGTKMPGKLGVREVWQEPMDMDANAECIVVAYHHKNAIRWLDPKTGAQRFEMTIDQPIGVVLDESLNVLVCSKDRLISVNPETKAMTNICSGLDTPTRVAVDPTNKSILVSCLGKTQQVFRYNRDGKRIAAYGQPGGRTHGLFTPERQASYLFVTDIAIASNGDFFTTEPRDAPRRTVWHDQDGKVKHSWYGGQIWAPFVSPEPGNPRFVWMASARNSILRIEIGRTWDSWRVHSTYQLDGLASGMIREKNHGDIWEVREHEGQLYLCMKQDLRVLRVDRESWRLVPAMVNWRWLHRAKEAPASVREWRGEEHSVVWTDVNGDGDLQREECRFHSDNPFLAIGGVSTNFTYFAAQRERGDAPWSLVVRHPTQWNAARAPVYPTSWQRLASLPKSVGFVEPRWGLNVQTDPSGENTYAAINVNMKGWGHATDCRLVKYNSAGNIAWQVGRKGTTPGTVTAFRRAIGYYNDCVMFGNFSREWGHDRITGTGVWDKNGLWVGPLMDNPDLSKGGQWNYALGGEALSMNAEPAPDGDGLLLYGCWINEGRLYRIRGWDGWERAEGTVTVGEQQPPAPQPEPLLKPYARQGTGLKMEHIPSGVRWSGMIVPTQTGLFHFILGDKPNDWHNGRLRIDGKELTAFENLFVFTKREPHPIVIEAADENVALKWVEPQYLFPDEAKPVPTSALFAE